MARAAAASGAGVNALMAQGAGDFATIGQPFVQPEGSTFAALRRSGDEQIVRSTYPDEGATAHATDHINAMSGVWNSSAVVYLGGPFNGFATSMSKFNYARTRPLVPVPSLGQCR